MRWEEVCNDPNLRDLPYRIETDEVGKIIMTPHKVQHSIFQSDVQALLLKLSIEGKPLPECAIHTHQGTKVVDVGWASNARLKIISEEIECSVAPEICIEVMSDSNTQKEMKIKRELYFKQGCLEFWLVYISGEVRFYSSTERLGETDSGEVERSNMFPEFPRQLPV